MKEMINVTEITEYLFCPRKLYLKRVKKLKQPQTDMMVRGMIKHKIFENFSNSEEELVSNIISNIDEPQILELYHKNLNQIILNVMTFYSRLIRSFNLSQKEIEDQAKISLENEISLRVKSIKETLSKGHLGESLWNNLKPKYLTEFQISSENLGIKGRIDRIKIDESVIPFEIKTREDIYESDKIQLAAYALLIEDKFSNKIDRGVVETKNKHQEILLTPELKNKVLEIAETIRNISEDNQPEFQNNFNKCRYCAFEKDCLDS